MARPRPPSCNEKCLSHTVMVTGEPAKLIKQLLEWQSNFIADKMRSGSLEAVRIPHFGVFRPKMKLIAAKGYGTRPKTTTRKPKQEEDSI